MTWVDWHRLTLLIVVESSLLVAFGLSRLAVYWGHRARFAGVEPQLLKRAFLIGSRMDLVASGLLLAPLIVVVCLPTDELYDSLGYQRFVQATLAAIYFLVLLSVGVEFFYFQEYGAKFNQILLEYARPNREVVAMLWKDYPILSGGLAVVALSALAVWALRPMLAWTTLAEASSLASVAQFVIAAAWVFVGCRGLRGRPIGVGAYEFSNSHLVNQLAANGIYQALRISYDEHRHGGRVADLVPEAPPETAFARLRELIKCDGATFVEGGVNPLDRRLRSALPARRPNVVVVILESHAASYVGALGAGRAVTPHFDRLAAEGLLFTRIYANGDRTARGVESILCSFPPLPGMSTLKRSGAHGRLFNAGGFFRARDYETGFYYGGDAAYDNLRGFILSNGFDYVFEWRDIQQPVWETTWGASDENVYARIIEDLVARPDGRPLFALALTISNHRPYTWPPGRIDPIYPHDKVASTFQYADFAMGRFIDAVRQTPAWARTVFVFVADHGVAVHGKSLVPVDRFHIPFLILAPAVPEMVPGRIDTLGSQLDVLPTLLGLLGGDARHCGFGRDLRKIDPAAGFAFLHYYGAYCYLKADRALMIRPHHKARLFEFHRQVPGGAIGELAPEDPDPWLREAGALLSSADHLYRKDLFHY